MGRPTKRQQINKKIGLGVSKMTQDNINKLKEVFAIDGTIAEACYYANISVQTYYDWIKKNPKLSEEFNALRERPVLKARQTVIKSLDQPDYAFKYLERKKKDEFSLRSELTGPEGELLSPIKIEIVNGNKSNNSVPEKLEQQKENSGESGVNEKQ